MRKYTLQDVFFFVILCGLSFAFYKVIEPFIIDILLGIIMLILFKRPFNYFKKKSKKERARPAMLTILLVLVVLVIPLTFVAAMVSREVAVNFDLISSNMPYLRSKLDPKLMSEYLSRIPLIGDDLARIDFSAYNEKIAEIAGSVTQMLIRLVQNTFVNITSLIINFFIIMFLMYYMLVDGNLILERIHFLIPLPDEDEDELFDSLEKVTDAIVINTLMIATVEGLYGGILFAIVGIPSPFFWGLIMVMLSLIPIVGSNSILLPAAIIELLIGNTWEGLVLLIFGVGVILLSQNILRPRLDGHKSGMHPALAFLGSMGGLFWIGIPGFLIGPLLTGLFLVIWGQYGKRYAQQLEIFNKGTHDKPERITEDNTQSN